MNSGFEDHRNLFFSEDLTINRLSPALFELFRLSASRGFSVSSEDIAEIERSRKAALDFVNDTFLRMKEQAEHRRENLDKYKDIHVISVGEDCFPRIICSQWGLRKFSKIGEQSVPFDLSTHPVLGTTALFKNNFEGYLDSADLDYKQKTKFCTNTKYKVLFNHEIGKHYADNDYRLLKEIYTRRLATFNSVMASDIPTVLVFHSISPNKDTGRHIKSLWQSIEGSWDTDNKLLVCINTWRLGSDIRETEPFSDQVAVLDLHYPIKNYIWFKPYFSYSKEGYQFEKTVVDFIKASVLRLNGFRANSDPNTEIPS